MMWTKWCDALCALGTQDLYRAIDADRRLPLTVGTGNECRLRHGRPDRIRAHGGKGAVVARFGPRDPLKEGIAR